MNCYGCLVLGRFQMQLVRKTGRLQFGMSAADENGCLNTYGHYWGCMEKTCPATLLDGTNRIHDFTRLFDLNKSISDSAGFDSDVAFGL